MPKTSEKYKTDYFFKKENDRSPIVFIHGVGLDQDMWFPQVRCFKNNSILTYEFTIHDAPFDNEIVIAIGGAKTGRAHARTGDRYQDMKEMGIESK